MSAAENLQVLTLFARSADDEATMALAVPDSVFEFHAQQAIEKLLKALIAAHAENFRLTHNLQVLVDQLKDLGEHLPDFAPRLTSFSKFAVVTRYDSGVPLTAEERQRFCNVVAALREFVTQRVNELP